MSPLRLGAVSYLNTKPLVYGLDAHPDQFDVRFDVPAKCAELLHEGRVDLGLIPAIEYLRGHYAIVPDISIASDGDVATVAVFHPKAHRACRNARARFELAHLGGAHARPVREEVEDRAEVHARRTRSRSDVAACRRGARDRRSRIRDRSGEAHGDQDRSGRGVEGPDRPAVRLCDVGRASRCGDALAVPRAAAGARRRRRASAENCEAGRAWQRRARAAGAVLPA